MCLIPWPIARVTTRGQSVWRGLSASWRLYWLLGRDAQSTTAETTEARYDTTLRLITHDPGPQTRLDAEIYLMAGDPVLLGASFEMGRDGVGAKPVEAAIGKGWSQGIDYAYAFGYTSLSAARGIIAVLAEGRTIKRPCVEGFFVIGARSNGIRTIHMVDSASTTIWSG